MAITDTEWAKCHHLWSEQSIPVKRRMKTAMRYVQKFVYGSITWDLPDHEGEPHTPSWQPAANRQRIQGWWGKKPSEIMPYDESTHTDADKALYAGIHPPRWLQEEPIKAPPHCQ